MPRLLALVLIVASFAHAAEPTTTTPASGPTVKAEDLPRVPPTEPKDAIAKFSVRPGFHVELVAAEPNVVSPIAMCFDENGRMFVCEMIDYSERRDEKLGRIRMLEDLDSDGVYEKSTVFLKGLPWPTAVMWVNGGVLVGACPDIIFAKDNDGDGVADESKVLFTGFGPTTERLNVQGLFNNFQWGMDNRIHGCSGSVGGMVTKVTTPPNTDAIDVRGKGFVIDPRDWSLTTENGGGQYGLSFDHLGRLWTCSNSVHIETFMYDARYAARNPYVTLPEPRICPAVDGPAAEVFRTSPEEPWRVIRTRWRIAGLVSGPVEGGGRSAGYFTGATGVTIYRGDAFGPDYVGDAFTGDAGGNLVHHKRVRIGKDGITPVAQRPDDERKIEFCASSDNWFRPVDFANTPDGSLFIADMYRETIEHPWSLPPQIKQFLDLNSGNDRGRIWRLAPDGIKPRPPPKLGAASTKELVKLLEHANGWHRETAARLLFERQDASATPGLVELLQKSPSPLARIHAMHGLDGLDRLVEADLIAAMSDSDAAVREHAIKLSEKLLAKQPPSKDLWFAFSQLVKDPDPRVRMQLAFTLGDARRRDRVELLAAIARRDLANQWTRAAILSSAADVAAPLFVELASTADAPFLEQLALIVGQAGDSAAQKQVATIAHDASDAKVKFAVTRGLADGMTRAKKMIEGIEPLVESIDDAAIAAIDPKMPLPLRLNAIALLAYVDYADAKRVLIPLIGGKLGQSSALTAIATLDQFDDSKVAGDVLEAWPALSPRAKSDAIVMLARRPQRAMKLLDAIEAKEVSPTDIDAAQSNLLRRHSDATVRERAAKILPSPSAQRDKVVETFRPALDLTGDAERGHTVFVQRCISCHRAAGEGVLVAPDFTTVRNAGREKLLLNILDPSREVAPQYVAYLVETKDGQDVLGILAADTPASITVRQAYGKETVIQRANIKRMTSQGKSLMPDGLEAGMSPQDAADLIAFIESVK